MVVPSPRKFTYVRDPVSVKTPNTPSAENAALTMSPKNTGSSCVCPIVICLRLQTVSTKPQSLSVIFRISAERLPKITPEGFLVNPITSSRPVKIIDDTTKHAPAQGKHPTSSPDNLSSPDRAFVPDDNFKATQTIHRLPCVLVTIVTFLLSLTSVAVLISDPVSRRLHQALATRLVPSIPNPFYLLSRSLYLLCLTPVVDGRS